MNQHVSLTSSEEDGVLYNIQSGWLIRPIGDPIAMGCLVVVVYKTAMALSSHKPNNYL